MELFTIFMRQVLYSTKPQSFSIIIGVLFLNFILICAGNSISNLEYTDNAIPNLGHSRFFKHQNNKIKGYFSDDDNMMENDVGKLHQQFSGKYNNNNHLDEEIEEECPLGFWWHLRGRRCVPMKCLGGNKQRDPGTGECIRKSRRKFNKSPRNYLSRMSSYRRFIPNLKQYRGRIF